MDNIYLEWRKLIMTKTKKSFHYKGTVEPIELMQAQMTPEAFKGFLRGNIIKYASRFGKKDDGVEEAHKIVVYATWLELAENNKTIRPKREDE
jgi:hypothetical protein